MELKILKINLAQLIDSNLKKRKSDYTNKLKKIHKFKTIYMSTTCIKLMP